MQLDRAETMRACALKVSRIERWKTATHAVESLIEQNRLIFSIVKCLLTAIYARKILITWYTSCSVFFRLSFNSKNIHVNKTSHAKMRG